MSQRKNTKPKPRATDSEVEKRALALVPLLLDGVGRAGLMQYAAKMWDISESTLYHIYLPRAREILREQANEMLAEPIAARILRIYTKALNDSKYQTALACLAELNKMTGNYAPAKAQLEVSDIKIEVVFTDEVRLEADDQD